MKKFLTLWLFIGVAHAQMPVIDPANLAQNLLTATQTLQSNLNEAEMLNNQIQGLINDAMNLEDLGYSIGEGYSEKFYALIEAMYKIQGLIQDYENLEKNFEELYPDYGFEFDKLPSVELSERSRILADVNRKMMEASHLVSSKVLQNVEGRHGELEGLVMSSEFAVGNKQLLQIGNQISATVSQNLIEMQSQMASFNQAQMAFMLKKSQEDEMMRNRLDHVTENLEVSNEEPVRVGKW